MTQESEAPLSRILEVLDPVLTPLGFAPWPDRWILEHRQVIFSQPQPDHDGRCVDIVLDVRKSGGADVRTQPETVGSSQPRRTECAPRPSIRSSCRIARGVGRLSTT